VLDVREYRRRRTKPVCEVAACTQRAGRREGGSSSGANGNLANVKGVGGGVLEYKIDFGPGYRIYFGRDGIRIVILLAGGTKKRQERKAQGQGEKRWR
jgi:hypothetical protein